MKNPFLLNNNKTVVWLLVGTLLLTATLCSSQEEDSEEGDLSLEGDTEDGGKDDASSVLLSSVSTTEETTTELSNEPELPTTIPQPKNGKAEVNKVENENEDDGDEDRDEKKGDDNDEDEGRDDEDETPTCDVKFFLDKIIPEDYYPHQEANSNNNGGSVNNSTNSLKVYHLNDTVERINRLHHFSTSLTTNLTPFLRQLASHLSDLLYEAQLPYECMGALMQLTSALSEQKTWALGCKAAFFP